MPTPPIKKIVLTGGPCGGKSTASSQLVERFEGMGWDVRAIPEVSTLFIGGGMKPWLSSERRLAFQRNIVYTEMSVE
jgi:tRNA uridine 5-carbamoylmethylation protein Kti12